MTSVVMGLALLSTLSARLAPVRWLRRQAQGALGITELKQKMDYMNGSMKEHIHDHEIHNTAHTPQWGEDEP